MFHPPRSKRCKPGLALDEGPEFCARQAVIVSCDRVSCDRNSICAWPSPCGLLRVRDRVHQTGSQDLFWPPVSKTAPSGSPWPPRCCSSARGQCSMPSLMKGMPSPTKVLAHPSTSPPQDDGRRDPFHLDDPQVCTPSDCASDHVHASPSAHRCAMPTSQYDEERLPQYVELSQAVPGQHCGPKLRSKRRGESLRMSNGRCSRRRRQRGRQRRRPYQKKLRKAELERISAPRAGQQASRHAARKGHCGEVSEGDGGDAGGRSPSGRRASRRRGKTRRSTTSWRLHARSRRMRRLASWR